VLPWYSGSLLAWDSTIFSSTEFTDYVGNTITVQDINGAAGSATISIGTDMPYGSGVQVKKSIIGKNGFPVQWVTSSYTLDFWHRTLISGYTFFGAINCLNTFSGPWASTPKYQLLNDYSGSSATFKLGNNVQYYNYTAIPWNTPVWHHYCFMYDSSINRHYLYIDGVPTAQYDVLSTGGSLAAFTLCGDVYNSTPTNSAIVERYRMRAGMKYPVTGFTVQEIYS